MIFELKVTDPKHRRTQSTCFVVPAHQDFDKVFHERVKGMMLVLKARLELERKG